MLSLCALCGTFLLNLNFTVGANLCNTLADTPDLLAQILKRTGDIRRISKRLFRLFLLLSLGGLRGLGRSQPTGRTGDFVHFPPREDVVQTGPTGLH